MDEYPVEAAGLELRRARLAAGVSLANLARMTHYSKGYLSKVETGRRPLTTDLARRTDAALGTHGKLIQRANTRTARGQVPLAGGLPGQRWPRPSASESRPATAVGDPWHIHRASVADMLLIFEHIRQLGRKTTPRVVLPMMTGFLNSIDMTLESARPAVSRELSLLRSYCADFVGWMVQEMGDYESAMWWTDRSMELAGSSSLAAYGLVRKAEFALNGNDPTLAIELASQANREAGESTRISGLAAHRCAQAHALMGQRYECARALDYAANMLDRPGEDPLAGLMTGSSSVGNLHAAVTAWCLFDLGNAEEAARILDLEVPRMPDEALRARTLFQARRALSHAECGNVMLSCDLAEEVLTIASCVESYTVRFDLHRLMRTLRRWQHQARVQELLGSSNLCSTTNPAT